MEDSEQKYAIDMNVVVDDLTNRIATLTKENAMLSAVLRGLATGDVQT